MSIAEFIREDILRPRLQKAGCLIVYDADQRYRELCHGLETETLRIVDAAGGSIESRELALRTLREVGQPNAPMEGVLIYVPAKRPETDPQKQADPFSIYAACGAVFPQDDGDDYLSLCLRAKPDHATEIRRVFAANPDGPPFAVVDAIGGGASWPQLRTALKVESAREILTALLVPSDAQKEALKAAEGWVQEAREFLAATLGLGLKTRGKTWNAVADELWRYLLFSEFAFDLPVPLPASIEAVPHAPVEARPIVEDVCAQLRGAEGSRVCYMERAASVESELSLIAACEAIEEFGERDTFAFEERAFLHAAIKAIKQDSLDICRQIVSRRRKSVWRNQGDSRSQWDLVSAGLALVDACHDVERQLPEYSRSQTALIDFYLQSLREVDRLQREFEQAVGDFLDSHNLMHELIKHARARYRDLTERLQGVFMKQLEVSGWPPSDRLANADAFDRLVAGRLKDRGRKVAYLMIDALRYELGVTLERLLAEDGPVELLAAYAQLPTITLVGMASLLPGARSNLTLRLDKEDLAPWLADARVCNVTQRMDVLAKIYGDRFAQMPLNDFVRNKPNIADTVDLLVLRSTEIDSQLENNPETTLGLIPGSLRMIRMALHKLRSLAFEDAVIVTDHGFFLNAQAEAGDVCTKPQGSWSMNAHDRLMLGDGVGDSHSLVVDAAKVGIRGDFSQAAMPRSMAPYRAGHLYFHGGASLAEAVVPVLVVKLATAEKTLAPKVSVEITYKSGATRITTRLPVLEIMLASDDMFSQEAMVEVLLEAVDRKGNVVGEPRPGGDVNPATRTITLQPGQRRQIALKMEPDFEGEFTVKALNPTTNATYCSLNLETDYTV